MVACAVLRGTVIGGYLVSSLGYFRGTVVNSFRLLCLYHGLLWGTVAYSGLLFWATWLPRYKQYPKTLLSSGFHVAVP